uniref:Uncharacterized protein n=1 Tax=Rhizophora mucronata TaxID=61149 RepID=A0A2P2N3I8_RHIMU
MENEKECYISVHIMISKSYFLSAFGSHKINRVQIIASSRMNLPLYLHLTGKSFRNTNLFFHWYRMEVIFHSFTVS